MPESTADTVEVCEEPFEKEKSIQGFADRNSTAGGQRNSYIYDTSNFALRRSLSCLALGRLGDVCGAQCILEMLERETDVWLGVQSILVLEFFELIYVIHEQITQWANHNMKRGKIWAVVVRRKINVSLVPSAGKDARFSAETHLPVDKHKKKTCTRSNSVSTKRGKTWKFVSHRACLCISLARVEQSVFFSGLIQPVARTLTPL